MAWKPFDRKKTDEQPDVARAYAEYQADSALGRLAYSSGDIICIMTASRQMREALVALLTPHLDALKCKIEPEPDVNKAVNSIIVIMDVRLKIDARLHGDYDRVLRMKKSMKKFGHDIIGVVGPRDLVSRYPRGTYGTLFFFTFNPENGRRYEDIPAEGQPTVGGPILYNLADMPKVLLKALLG